MNESKDLAVTNELATELTIGDVKNQVAKIQQLMKGVMQDGQHYGTIPGAEKPTLYKAGAEKINFMFRFGTGELEITKLDMPNGHREITIKTPIIHIPTGTIITYGIGSCSTMESKYRYRNLSDYEITGEKIPNDAKSKKSEYRKKGFGMKKVDGVWEWVKFTDSKREENPDIADIYNTVLKMAAKRSYVDGTIKASAASDFFTQDIEDFEEEEVNKNIPRFTPQPIKTDTQATFKKVEPQQQGNPIVADFELSPEHEPIKESEKETTKRDKLIMTFQYYIEKGLIPNKNDEWLVAIKKMLSWLERNKDAEMQTAKFKSSVSNLKMLETNIPAEGRLNHGLY